MKGLHFKLILKTVRVGADQFESRIASALEQAPFWHELHFVKMMGHPRSMKLTPATFRKARNNEDSRGWSLSSPKGYLELILFRSIQTGSFVFRIFLREKAWRQYSTDTAEWLPQFLAALGHPRVFSGSGISPDFNPDLPEDPVPLFSIPPYLSRENVIDIIDERIIASIPNWEGDAKIARMLSAPLDGFRREVKEKYTLIRFVEDLTDEHQLAEGRARHGQWLTKVIVPD
jgi:hypothetical protein